VAGYFTVLNVFVHDSALNNNLIVLNGNIKRRIELEKDLYHTITGVPYDD
ncbi:hypothetical protein A2U01_0118279, partial [Trifolium medium]|nr:hypothetical protein [Trifolium medium]